MKFICCEAGVAWRYLSDIHELCHRASICGADAIKFQIYNKEIVKQANPKWHKHLLDCLIDRRRAKMIMEIADEYEIECFFTPMYLDAVNICEDIGVKRYKVRAADAYNDQLLLELRQTRKPCYISRNSYKKIDPLKQRYFYTVYYDEKRPTKISDVMKGYSNLLRSDGYSCHCNKLLNVMSVMLFPGIDYIELHVSLDPSDKTLPDQAYSYGFTDIYELCRFRDLLNSRARENPSKWEIA